jgi:hypothetical protein
MFTPPTMANISVPTEMKMPVMNHPAAAPKFQPASLDLLQGDGRPAHRPSFTTPSKCFIDGSMQPHPVALIFRTSVEAGFNAVQRAYDLLMVSIGREVRNTQ